MKKLLLSLACLCGLTAWAGEVTDVLNYSVMGLDGKSNYAVYDNIRANSDAVYYAQCASSDNSIQLRSNNNNSGVVSTTSGGRLVSVMLEFRANTAAGRQVDVYGSNVAYTTAADLYGDNAGTLLGSFVMGEEIAPLAIEGEYAYVGLRSKSGALYLDNISIVWANDVQGTQVARPMITADNNNMVTITCATEGAEIHYTIDGTEPTVQSTLYTAPFAITEDVTVKAIAVAEDGTLSDVTSKDVAYVGTYATLAEMLAAKPAANATCQQPVVVAFQNAGKNYTYVTADGTYALVYGTLPEYHHGDVIPGGWMASFTVYSNLPELVPVGSTFAEATTTAECNPVLVKCADVSAAIVNYYVVLENVEVTQVGTKDFQLVDESGTLALYNRFNLTLAAAAAVDVVGCVAVYGDKVQLYPITITPRSSEFVAAPTFTVEAGEVEAGTEVGLECVTEGATIYWSALTANGGSTEYVEYTAPIAINEDVTISAYAKKGDSTSDVVTAAYYLKKAETPVDKNVTFDFTDPAGLTPAVEAPAPSEATSVNDVVFTNGNVLVSCEKGADTSTDCRLWNASGKIDLRIYTSSTITVSTTVGYGLQKIVFTKAGGSVAVTPNDGKIENLVWTPTEGKNPGSVIFTATGTTRISTMTVYYTAIGTGVNDVEVAEDATVVYYNLQGVRVAEDNLTPGLYIRQQGGQTSKVLVK